jgi:hypothetical protein
MICDCAFCILAEDGKQAEIGFTLAHQHHEKGDATEVIKGLLEHFWLNIYPLVVAFLSVYRLQILTDLTSGLYS